MKSPRKRIWRVRLYFVLALMVFAAGWLSRLMPRSAPAPRAAGGGRVETSEGPTCRVRRVVDGDTLVADCGGRRERIRLLHIDTPETGTPGAAEAEAALARLVSSGQIRLVFEGGPGDRRDKHGRLLAYVRAKGLNVNVEIVEQGYSRHWTRYGRGALGDELDEAERRARKAESGLWIEGSWNPGGEASKRRSR
jgi:micrococcal nuclease